MSLDFSMLNAMAADMDARVAEATARRAKVEQDYEARRIRPDRVGIDIGPAHAASILVWTRIAELAKVPYIPAQEVAFLTMDTVMALADEQDTVGIDNDQIVEVRKATQWANAGNFWRTDICASEEVKYLMGSGKDLPPVLGIRMDDIRIYEMHWGMPGITVVGRPKLTPVRHGGYPVEFRVFNGCQAEEDGAVSWYYPQASEFARTAYLEDLMTQAAEWGNRLHAMRADMGITPWLPGQGEPDAGIGSTIDFMLTEEMGLVMVDAGPGYGAGAHPCCFIDVPVKGRAWALSEGIKLR